MNILKIFIVAVLSLSLFRLVRFELKNTINIRTFFFWAAILIGSVVFLVYPTISEKVATLLGIGRGVDSIFFLSILLLLYLNFQLYMRIQKMDQTMTTLTQNISCEIHLLRKAGQSKSDLSDRNL
jgi:hypothetical protein